MWKSGKVWKFWKKLKFGKINGSLEKFWKLLKYLDIWKCLEIIWKFGQLKIWKKKFGNNLEIWEKFGMLDKFRKFGKFLKLRNKI